MPRSNGVYSNPGWVNGTTPAINATEMNAISDTLTTVGVQNGGTGKTSHTANSVIVGNGTNAVKNIASRSGAFFSLSTDGLPQFGVLPMSCGGTGSTGIVSTDLGTSSNVIKEAHLKKFGNVVMADITTQSINVSFETASYIPSGYRPQRNTWFTFTGSHSGSTKGIMSAWIDSDGCIHGLDPMMQGTSAQITFHATVTYYTAQ